MIASLQFCCRAWGQYSRKELCSRKRDVGHTDTVHNHRWTIMSLICLGFNLSFGMDEIHFVSDHVDLNKQQEMRKEKGHSKFGPGGQNKCSKRID